MKNRSTNSKKKEASALFIVIKNTLNINIALGSPAGRVSPERDQPLCYQTSKMITDEDVFNVMMTPVI